ncbi:MAG: HlyD family type I secretion periplasmic adaptor subunit [Desulfobulbaceae bacterium]|nr:HlyD family type I secretion periplasmic adaptor subunit [Desulfobulbaceae bacterium]
MSERNQKPVAPNAPPKIPASVKAAETHRQVPVAPGRPPAINTPPVAPAPHQAASARPPLPKRQIPPETPAPPSAAGQEKSPGVFRRMPAADLDLVTDIRNTLLIQSPKGGRVILWMLALIFIAFVVWASLSHVDEATRGDGKVIPSSQIQVVQNLEGGILSEMLVHVGDIVEKDQLLLKIDKTMFNAPVMENKVTALALQAQIARLEAEVDNKEFVPPPEVVKEKPDIASREKQLFDSRRRQIETKLQIFDEQYRQRQQELRETQTKLAESRRSSAFLQKELSMTRPLVAQGAASEIELLRLERQDSQLTGEIASMTVTVEKIHSQIDEARKAMESERLNFTNAARAELNDAYAKFESSSATSVALRDRLQRTEVRSPVRGTINRILVNTVSGVIQPGMDLVEIVPLEDTLLIEAQIKPQDIAFLRPNQQAMVKFTAYDFTIYGGLDAGLEHISADSITDKQGNDFYLVRLRTKQNHLGTPQEPLPIIPGMVATVDILTGKKTIMSYLLKPILRARQTALRER